jgi:sugar lactone lactonase YvrE
MREVGVIAPNDLPDYRPPFTAGAVRADADGNLWIRTIPPKPVPGGIIFDVVNATGELADRIQLPSGYTLVGFGRGKVVYLSMRDAKGIHLARVRLR